MSPPTMPLPLPPPPLPPPRPLARGTSTRASAGALPVRGVEEAHHPWRLLKGYVRATQRQVANHDPTPKPAVRKSTPDAPPGAIIARPSPASLAYAPSAPVGGRTRTIAPQEQPQQPQQPQQQASLLPALTPPPPRTPPAPAPSPPAAMTGLNVDDAGRALPKLAKPGRRKAVERHERLGSKALPTSLFALDEVPDGARRVRPVVDERRDGFFDRRAVRESRDLREARPRGGGGGGGSAGVRTRGVGGKEADAVEGKARRGRGKPSPPPRAAAEEPLTSMPPGFFNPQFARLLQQNAALRHSVFAAA